MASSEAATTATLTQAPTLDIRALSVGYNGQPVVRDLDLHVAPGEIVALLGPNGAGKTTTLASIAGLIRPLSGEIEFEGESVAGRSAAKLARRGMALVPEDRALFADLTTRENLRLARRRGKDDLEQVVLDLLPELKKCLERKAGHLSGGEQQMLAVGRALVTEPRLLMVDEMSLGLAPIIVQRLLPVLHDVASRLGTAIVLVEQHVSLALEVADRAYVLAHGRLVLEGDAARLRSQTSLIAASYFGDLDTAAALSSSTVDELDDVVAPPEGSPPPD